MTPINPDYDGRLCVSCKYFRTEKYYNAKGEVTNAACNCVRVKPGVNRVSLFGKCEHFEKGIEV